MKHQPGSCRGVLLCRVCAAAYLGVSTDTLDDVVRPDLPHVRVGGRVLLARTDVDHWIAAHREWPSAPALPPRLPPPLAKKPDGSLAHRAVEIACDLRSTLRARTRDPEVSEIVDRLMRKRRGTKRRRS